MRQDTNQQEPASIPFDDLPNDVLAAAVRLMKCLRNAPLGVGVVCHTQAQRLALAELVARRAVVARDFGHYIGVALRGDQ